MVVRHFRTTTNQNSMKQKIEEAACEYMDILPVKSAIKCGDIEDLESHIKVAFKSGAEWQAKQMAWVSVKNEFPPYNKEVLLINNRNKTIGCQIFNDGYDIKTYCDWYCISYWMLANFPE